MWTLAFAGWLNEFSDAMKSGRLFIEVRHGCHKVHELQSLSDGIELGPRIYDLFEVRELSPCAVEGNCQLQNVRSFVRDALLSIAVYRTCLLNPPPPKKKKKSVINFSNPG